MPLIVCCKRYHVLHRISASNMFFFFKKKKKKSYCKLDMIHNFNSSYILFFISWLPLVPFLSWKITTRRPAIILTSYVGIGERGLLRGRSTTYMVWVSVYQTYKKFCKKKATKRVLLKYKLTFYWFVYIFLHFYETLIRYVH